VTKKITKKLAGQYGAAYERGFKAAVRAVRNWESRTGKNFAEECARAQRAAKTGKKK
jgi:hypothetical protein